MAKPKIDDEQAKAKPERDTRPLVKPRQVLAAIPAAVEAMRPLLAPGNMGPTVPPRWSSPPAWGPLRAAFHVLPDAERREAIVRLLLEEAERIAHDEGATISYPSAVSSRRRDH